MPPVPGLAMCGSATLDFFEFVDISLAARTVLPSEASIKLETVRGLLTFDRNELTRPIDKGKACVETNETIEGGSQPPKSPRNKQAMYDELVE